MVRESESKDADVGLRKDSFFLAKATSQSTCAHFPGGTTTVPLLNLNLMFSRLSAPLFPAAVGLGCNPLCRQRPPSHQTAHLAVDAPEKAGKSKRADTADSAESIKRGVLSCLRIELGDWMSCYLSRK
jgi:hypothetical protein